MAKGGNPRSPKISGERRELFKKAQSELKTYLVEGKVELEAHSSPRKAGVESVKFSRDEIADLEFDYAQNVVVFDQAPYKYAKIKISARAAPKTQAGTTAGKRGESFPHAYEFIEKKIAEMHGPILKSLKPQSKLYNELKRQYAKDHKEELKKGFPELEGWKRTHLQKIKKEHPEYEIGRKPKDTR